jgi:predicted extracellular nuclease/2',3'-cyclic-nucleotide 2'-phosphodiesterase (5'-nucleotidase family)
MAGKLLTRIVFFLLVIVLARIPAYAQAPTDLFISEYVEGSSNNKAIELFNGTGSVIDLAAGGYVIQMYFNGSTTVGTTVTLTGTVASGSTFVLAQSSASFAAQSYVNQTNSGSWYNGDDVIILRKGGSSGTIVDVIGQLGFDPGAEWGTGVISTADNTLRRKSSVCQGDNNSSDIFDPSVQFDGIAQDDFSGLGAHSNSCVSSGIILNPVALVFNTIAGTPSGQGSYTIQGNGLTTDINITAPANFSVSLVSGGPYTSSVSIPFATANAGPIPVYVIYNRASVGTDNANIIHTSGSTSVNLNVQGSAVSSFITGIPAIQGSGASSPLVGTIVTTEGFVLGDFQPAGALGGFFLQDISGDGDPATSDGIFVLYNSMEVNVGDRVRVTGTVMESFNRTQISSVTAVTILSSGNPLPVPSQISLPVTSQDDLERYEGMLVAFPQTLTVSDNFTLGRFGELRLSEGGRLFNPTSSVDPNDVPSSGTSNTANNIAAVNALLVSNNNRSIVLNDASNTQNPGTVPFIDPVTGSLRTGSTVTNVTGILDYAFNTYRIQPTLAPVFSYAPRPAVPSVGSANLKVAAFNVLNYFNGDGLGGGFPTSRGANTPNEFTRQRDKIISAISQLDADVVGLIEIENDGSGANSAIADLVNGLNAVAGAGTWAFIADPTGANGNPGTDAIKQAIIYKPGRVTPQGLALADNNAVYSRPPIAQVFTLNSNAERFTVVVNHFKSKSCSGATVADVDQGDGQGCFNESRKLQAAALLTFVNTLVTTAGDNDVVIVGDLNAYEEEDPIDILRAGGLIKVPNGDYTYVFGGQTGTLDYALVTSSLFSSVTGAAAWHINADEPVFRDYNTEFNPTSAYAPDAFRSSDHDPVLVGLNMQPATFKLQLLHASDFEGDAAAAVDAPNFAAVLDKLEDTYPNTLRLSSGDNIIPSPFSRVDDPSLGPVLNATYNQYYGTSTISGLLPAFARADIAIMNFLGIEASALGNHEFDQGTADLRAAIAGVSSSTSVVQSYGVQFPYLSANLTFTGDASLSSLFTADRLANTAFRSSPAETAAAVAARRKIAPSTIITVNGQRIGVVGVTTPILASISTVNGVTIKNPGAGTDNMQLLAQVIQPTIDDLRNTEGINKIILLAHLQQLANEKALATFLRGVDVIVAGGSNTLMADTNDRLRSGDAATETYPFLTTDADGNPVAIINTDGNYSYVGRLVVDFDQNGLIVPSSIDPLVSGVYATDVQGVTDLWGTYSLAFVPGTKGNLVKQVADAVGAVIAAKDGNILGKTSVWLEGRRNFVRTQETNLGNLTADANLWIGKFYDPTTVVSIKNGGGIRSEIGFLNVVGGVVTPEPPQANPLVGKLQGDISQLDVENALRFNNTLSLVSLRAADLKRILEHAVRATTATATPGQFAQVGGIRFSFDRTRPALDRIRNAIIVNESNVTLDTLVKNGVVAGDSNRLIRVITLGFLADGGDGYPFPALTSNRVNLSGAPELGPGATGFASPGSEQDAFAEYLRFFHAAVPYNRAETPATQDERIQEVGVTRVDCIVPTPPNPGTYGPLTISSAPITLTGSPAGGTWSGTGVTGNTFNPAVGTQTLTYTVNLGPCSSSATVTIVVGGPNQPPTISFSSPANNSSFPAGTPVTLQVNAADADGSVVRVAYFNDGAQFFESMTEPFSFTSSTMIEPGTYRVVARAYDNAGDSTNSDTLTVVITPCAGTGAISGEGYTGIPGASVSDLTAHPSYPNSPSISGQLPVFEYNNIGDDYGGRLRGYICVPETGDYIFYISGDDQAGLYLSTDENPANKVLIAYTLSFTGFREWNKFSTQQSAPIRLVRGVRYYVETLHKESSGADHLSVGWRRPNGTFERPIAGSRLSPFTGSASTSISAPVDFVREMRGVGQFSVKAIPNPSRSYFSIAITGEQNTPAQLRVVDALGRVIEQRAQVPANSQLQLGQSWRPGIYMVEIRQGVQRKVLKLVKE